MVKAVCNIYADLRVAVTEGMLGRIVPDSKDAKGRGPITVEWSNSKMIRCHSGGLQHIEDESKTPKRTGWDLNRGGKSR